MICGDSSIAEQPTLQLEDGGAIPTSPLHIRKISHAEAKNLVKQFHYLGETRFLHKERFGLYLDGFLVGAAIYGGLSAPETAVSAFGLPRGNYSQFLELHRLVLSPNTNGQNCGSYLLGRSLRQLKKDGYRAVISYADVALHVGFIYQATNFTYHGLTTPKCDFFVDGVKQSRGPTRGKLGEWRPRNRKHRYVFLLDKTLTVKWPQKEYPKK
jgi:hypothetical protein